MLAASITAERRGIAMELRVRREKRPSDFALPSDADHTQALFVGDHTTVTANGVVKNETLLTHIPPSLKTHTFMMCVFFCVYFSTRISCMKLLYDTLIII